MTPSDVSKKIGLVLWLVIGFITQSSRLNAQCNVSNTGTSAAPTCSTQSLSLGAGESRNITYTSGVTYTFSFTNNAQSNGACVGGVQYTTTPVNVTILSPTGTVVTGMFRSNGTWSGTSATLSYKIADATTASIGSAPAAVCAGGTTTALTGNIANVGTGTWSCTAVPAGGNAAHITFNSVNAENSTVSVNASAVPGNYTLQWRIDNGGCSSSATTTLTVAAKPSITTNPTSPSSICAGGTSGTMSIAATGGTPSLSYQWQYSSDNTSWSNTANGTPAGSTYTNSALATGFTAAGISGAGTYYYRGLASASGSGCTAAASTSASLSVVADPSVSVQPSNATAVCVGGSTSFSYTASGGTPSLSHRWQYSANGTNGWVDVANGTPSAATYSGQTTNTLSISNIGTAAGTYYYRSVISATGSDCGTTTTNVVSVTAAADPSITSQPSNATAVCVGGSTSFSYTASGGTPSLSHQWQYSADGTSGWSNVANGSPNAAIYSGQNSASLSVTSIGSVSGTHYYRSVISATGSDCGSTTTNVVSVTAATDPEITVQPANASNVCVGGSTNFSYTASGGTPSLSHQWQFSTDGNSGWANVANGTPAGSTYSGQNSNALSISSIGSAAGTYYYRSIVSASGSDCASAKTDVVSVTAVAVPNVSSQPSNANSVCVGGSASFSYSASGGTPSLSHQWQYSADGTSGWSDVTNGIPSGSSYSGETTTSLSVTNIGSVAGTHYYRSVISASGSGCGNTTTQVVSVTAAAAPTITAQPTNASAVCAGGNTSFSYSATGGTPSLNHQWQYSADGSSAWSNVADGTPVGSTYTGQSSSSLNITNVGTVAGTHYYRSLLSATGGNCSSTMTDVVNVSVAEVPSISSHPSSPDPVCVGGTSTPLSVIGTGGAPALNFTWQFSADSTNWNNAVNNTPAGASYSNSSLASGFTISGIQSAGEYFYRAVLSASASGCSSATSNPVKFTVVAAPSISATSISNDSSCAGSSETASVTASGGASALQYQWQYQLNGVWNNVANQTPAGISYTGSNTADLGIQTTLNADAGTFKYRCVVSAVGNACDTVVSTTLTLSVLPSVWLGITSNATDPNNWLNGCVPVPGSRVEINSTAVYDLPLTGTMTVSKLSFNGSGKKVVLGNYDLTADTIAGADATNYVLTNGNGKLCMNLNTSKNKTFPVGRSAYNPVKISNNTAGADNFCVRVLDEVYSEGTTGSVLSLDPRIKRTWDIDKGNGSANSADGVDFQFWWNANETALNPNTATFYLSHFNGTIWEQQPGTAVVSGRSLTYIGYMGGFSPFAINANWSLPVSWVYVKGECNAGQRILNWATATELNNRAFVIEGSSDGASWKTITEVAGQKESSSLKTYSLNLDVDYSYFRIRQEDFDGAFDYSEVVYLSCSSTEAEVAIVPNPSEGVFRILGADHLGTYVLFNALGQKVLEGNCSNPAQRSLDLSGLEKGIYSLRISGSAKDILKKLVLK